MASTYLTWQNSTATNSTKFTMSGWVKRGNLNSSSYNCIMSCRQTSSSNAMGLWFGEDKVFFNFGTSASASTTGFDTSAKVRDVNGWYHIVVAGDASQSGTDKLKVWINGTQQTSFVTDNRSSFATLEYDFGNTSYPIQVGRKHDGTFYWDGSMSHIHFVDGTAYQASDFGLTDSTTGEWKINTSPSVTYGNNGFFILKDGNSGTDQSGEGNNFTVGGGTLTKTEDNPSNVFATMNPLNKSLNTDRSFANGNTYVVLGGTARVPEVSTLGMTSGKFYAEMKDISGSGGASIMGITGQMHRTSANDYLGSQSYDYAYYSASGAKINNGNEPSYGNSWTDGDIIGVAVDLDNLKIYFSKNGTWQNSGDPTSGSTGTGAAFTLSSPSSTDDGAYFFACSDDNAYAERRMAWNFGNGYFQTTAVSSAGTNASNNGIFEYDVPTGYTALSTKGLNL